MVELFTLTRFQHIRRQVVSLISVICFGVYLTETLPPVYGQSPAPVSFHKQIQPILQRSCQGCHHAGDAGGGVVLTSYQEMRKGGEKGDIFTSGKPEESLIIELISGDAPVMPQKGDALTPEEVNLFRRWIAEGAVDDTPPPAEDSIRSDKPPVYTAPPVISALAYSPDGKTLAISGYREVLLYKSDGSALMGRLVGKSHRIESIDYSPDGKILAAVGGAPAKFGEVQLWDASTNTLIRSIQTTYDTVYGASFSPSGTLLAFGCADKTARVISVADGKELIKFDNHSDWVFGAAFSMDGTHFVTGSRDSALKLVDVQSASFIDDINASNKGYGGVNALARHPKADQILSAGDDGTPRLYRIFREKIRDVGNTDFNLIRAFERQPGVVNAVDFNPDGTKIVVGNSTGQAYVYSVADGTLLATLKGDSVSIFAAAFHPDGNQIAVGGFDGKVRIFDAESGDLIQVFLPFPLAEEAMESLKQKEVILAVNGMSCSACVGKVQNALAGISGVAGVDVSLKNKTAVVQVRNPKVTIADLSAAVKQAGFEARTAN
jgi:WD40 repeat protein